MPYPHAATESPPRFDQRSAKMIEPLTRFRRSGLKSIVVRPKDSNP